MPNPNLKPCHFCGEPTELKVLPNQNTKSWFQFPFEQYPACQTCKKAHDTGDIDEIVNALQKKFFERKNKKETEV